MTKKKKSTKVQSRSAGENQSLVKFLIFTGLIFFGFFLGNNLDKIKLPNLPRVNKLTSSEKLSPRQLKSMLKSEDLTLINVHTPYEGEIEKTDSFIEYDSMKASKALPTDKNTLIVLYCKTGRMSTEALQTLKSMGYKNVRHLEGGMDAWKSEGYDLLDLSSLPDQVLPEEGFELPVRWSDLGPRLVSLGVIDRDKFSEAVKLTDEESEILTRGKDEFIKIDSSNSQFVVDMLWAVGLAQKSRVYDEGPMGKEYKKDVGNFASTGGWTLARGNAVNYLNKYDLVPLDSEQQDRVSDISKNVFRPCCGNSTWFPDCNHGMAALAAIELMVYQGLSDEEVYKNVLKLNSFWFPSHYLTLATHFARQGLNWDRIDAKLALSEDYSSGKAAGIISKQVGPLPFETKYGGSCGA